MSIEENKALVRRLMEAYNEQQAHIFDELASPEMAQELRESMQSVYATFAGHHIDITDMLAEGEQVWVRVVVRGGHSGEWEGIPPTGKQWTNPGMAFFRLADGKVVEQAYLFDSLHHLKQLGATIAPPVSTNA